MDVKTLCLGLLNTRPASGYDLKKEFESQFKHFFPAGYGSIYPALADLAAAGYVECEEIAQQGKPDRKVYAITSAGQHAFSEALAKANPQHKMRSEFLAMMYFAELMDVERLGELLDGRLAELRATIAQIDHAAGTDADLAAGARFVAGFGATLAAAAAAYIEEHGPELLKEARHDNQGSGRRTRRASATTIENRV
jgi:DNA-binding PadR family transcriptional regulator